MFRKLPIILLFALIANPLFSQSSFDYTVDIEPVNISGLPGLHSYAYAQHNGKWLIIGGRKDGIHARQPFNAFPQTENNTDIYVIDVNTQQFWSATTNTLPTSIKEHVQSANMNFYQDNDTLYLMGGYAFSATANDHITYPNLTSINVPALINAVVSSNSISSSFKQITDTVFAVTGGHLGKLGNTFLLVGGHRFDGQYNPMGHATYTQSYTNQIRKFELNNSGAQLSYSNYSTTTDPIHLRRRDYNLLPQIFPNGEEGYTISSGVFQIGVDLPFLYPVDITDTSYTPITGFNQYLSNYHSAFACLYDTSANEMHSLFFGGISQYYYQGGILIQDNEVPFVKTISRLTRSSSGTLQEFLLPTEMPALNGASAEFITNQNIPHYQSDIIKLSDITQDTILIGHIYGGITSPSLNPFSNNQTSTTSASSTVYSVRLIKNTSTAVQEIDGSNPYSITVFPNPVNNELQVVYSLSKYVNVKYFIADSQGQIMQEGEFLHSEIGLNKETIFIDNKIPQQALFLTFIFDNKFYISKKLMTI